MTESTSNGFGNALLQGLKWGAIISGILWIIIAISSSSDSSVDLGFGGFIFGLLLFGIGGGILGSLCAGIFLGVVGFLTFIGGTLLSLATITATAATSTIMGWVSVALLPILLIIKGFVFKNAPDWLDKSINGAMVSFLTCAIFTLLKFFFEKAIGLELASAF